MGRDWVAWHADYDDPASRLSRRLRVVQAHVATFLDSMPPKGARVISACAGEGRDLLGVLTGHPRRHDVKVRLVELDERLAAAARARVETSDLAKVEVVEGDAGITDSYAGAVPADLILMCGVFGNITPDDIENTIRLLPSLSAPVASVIWTRHPREPGVIDDVCRWFSEAGYELCALDVPDDRGYAVGVHRLTVEPPSFEPARRMFSFVTT